MRHHDAILAWHPFLDLGHELSELRPQLLDGNRLGRVFLREPPEDGAMKVVSQAYGLDPRQARSHGADVGSLRARIVVEAISAPAYGHDAAKDNDHNSSRS